MPRSLVRHSNRADDLLKRALILAELVLRRHGDHVEQSAITRLRRVDGGDFYASTVPFAPSGVKLAEFAPTSSSLALPF